MKLTERIYAYPWRNPSINNCNSYILKSDVITLLDPGHSRFVDQLLIQIRADRIFEEQIRLIVTTHSHPDHFEGLQLFLHRPVLMAMNLKEDVYIQEVGNSLYRMMGMSIPRYRVDFYLKEGDLRLGNDELRIYEIPGHSPGSICIYWPREKALFSGDVIFSLGVGRTDFPGGNGKLLLQGIRELSRLDTEILLPGHGDIVVGRERVSKNFQYVLDTYSNYL